MSDQIPTAVPNQSPATEEWRPIPGYEELYEVSDQGRVRSLKNRFGTPRVLILRIWRQRSGYLNATLTKNGKARNFLVHRLVLLAFVGAHTFRTQANHKNGDRACNRLTNLEWLTCSENHLHAFRELGKKPTGAKGSDHPNSKFTDEQIIDVRARLARGETYTSLAKEFHVHRNSIWNIRARRTWNHVQMETPGLESYVQTELNIAIT